MNRKQQMKKSTGTNGNLAKMVELLEGRTMLSASMVDQPTLTAGVGRGLLNQAASLGAFKLKSHKAIAGTVGNGTSDVVYQVTVTAPIDLSLQLSKLKQRDQLNLLFSDGTIITSANSTGPVLKFTQRLDPGTYYVDVFNGINSGLGAANTPKIKVKKYHFKATGNYSLSLKAIKPDDTVAPVIPQKAPGGALQPNAGLGVEPAVDAGLVNHWVDVSANPLWGPNGPSPDDIKQGQNGDCYFLSTISDIARVNPGLIEQHIIPEPNNTYKVIFESNGQDVAITVDTQLPVDANGNYVYASLGTNNATWVPLMEKAFCFFRDPTRPPSYAAIANGWSKEVFEDFGSTDISTITQNQINTGPAVVTTITNWLNAGRMVTLGTHQGSQLLHELHLYSVVGINGDGTIELRNPWGVNPPNNNDGGYLAITGEQALIDMSGICSATLPIIAPTNNVPVTPTPVVTPTPTTPTPTDVTPPAYTTVLDETLGNENSFTLADNRFVDEYQLTSPADTTEAVAIASTVFTAQVQVVQVFSDGTSTVVAQDANTTPLYYAAVVFNAKAGATYDIVVTPNAVGGSGAYTLNYSAGLTGLIQGTPIAPLPTPGTNNTPTSDPYPVVSNETLGTSNSFVLSDTRYADAYVVSATINGSVSIAAASSVFNPQIEVLQVYSDGTTSLAGQDDNPTQTYYGAVTFDAQAGATYEIIVLPDQVGSSGAYTLNLSTGFSGVQVVSPSSY